MKSFQLDPNWREDKDEMIRVMPVAGCLAAMCLVALFVAGCLAAAGCASPRNEIPNFGYNASAGTGATDIVFRVILGGTELSDHGGSAQEWKIAIANHEDRWVDVDVKVTFRTDAGETIQTGGTSITLSPRESRIVDCPKIVPKKHFTAITAEACLASKKYVEPRP